MFMKKFLAIISIVVAVAATSCKKADPVMTYRATGTAKMLDESHFFIEVDDNLAVIPSNMKAFPFATGQKEQRLQFFYSENKETVSPVPGYATTKSVTVYDFALTLTKNPLVYDSSKTYPKDPLGLYLDEKVFPHTMIEDGYLSVSFVMPFGVADIAHEVNLLTDIDPEDPYTVKFIHDAKGNAGPYTRDGLVCFPLKSLPDTEGKTVKLTLKWDSTVTGKEESVKFDYCSRTDW